MQTFSINSKIHECETFKEFNEAFNLGADDLIFTHEFLYNDYMKIHNQSSHAIFCEKYGTGEPNDAMITNILKDISTIPFKRIIGIGGGTVLDITKLLAVKDASCFEDIFEDRIPLVRECGLILIPTTCGTGCEMTCVSVVDIPKRNSKIGKRIEANFADHAVLIPEFLEKLPHVHFAYSAIDALVHVMEIYLAPPCGEYSRMFCREAIALLIKSFSYLVENGIEKRNECIFDILRASNYAGIALSNTVCGAVHACALHFGAKHHVAHGESNYRFLLPVFRQYVKIAPDGLMSELVADIGSALQIDTDINSTFEALDSLLNELSPRKSLQEYGVNKDDLSDYVDTVIATQERLLNNNYVPLSKEALLQVYNNAY